MNDITAITSKIMNEAENEAKSIISSAKEEAQKIISGAKEKAEAMKKENSVLCEKEAQKIREREILSAKTAIKRRLLSKKQELIERTVNEANERLISLNDEDYKSVVTLMLKRLPEENCEIIVSERDAELLKDIIAKNGFSLATQKADIKGFIAKYDTYSLNFSFESLFSENDEIMKKTAEILFR